MNRAKLITASGHAWEGCEYGIERAAVRFLGKTIRVMTPAGMVAELVKAVELFNESGKHIGLKELSQAALTRRMSQDYDARPRDEILAENVKLKERIAELEKDYELLGDAKANLEQDYCALLERE